MSKVDYDKKKFDIDEYGNLYPKTVCSKHPKYKAIYKPKCNCNDCWLFYYDQKKKHSPTNDDDGYGTVGGGRAPLD